ncbi:hypothetical protein KUTeg_010274 [Tegillarca granosa]|uniref:PPM-type phosphatase domain-containing protein n=1 Tax=Tegillarca granosa TaxID=220873 RepID=A0ABQ9F8H8_TEGGR|nr:hypothetical protein KUTeg_010274 [Tegillarca granosa]
MEEPYGNDIPSFKEFLTKFVQSISENSEDNDDLPFRLSNLHFVPEELHGECLELCLRYLNLHNCPELLSAAISRAAYEEIQNIDQSEFEDDEVNNKSESQDEKKEEKNVKEDKIIDNKSHKVFSSAILCTHLLDIVNDICKKWQKNLPDIPDQPHQSYYAVFDGHAGVEASVYASTHLHLHMINSPDFQTDPATALKYAYKTTDDKFVAKAQRENIRSGSTGISVLIRGDKLHLAWLGDSQAVLVKNGKCVSLMEPHKPERDDEKSRIESLGGIVLHMGTWRVNGNLAVSRAIGDASQKRFICSDADTVTIDLDGTEDYIVLACDGLWDTVSQESISDIVYGHLQETNGDKSSVARKLVTIAKDNGSSDNITVIVVFLRDEIAKPHIKQLFDFTGEDSQGNDDVEKGDNPRGDDSDHTDSNKSNSNLPDNSNTSDTNVDSHKTDHKVNNSETSEQSHNPPSSQKDQNTLEHSQKFLTVNSTNQDSGTLSEISDHSSETPEISAVRKVNQKNLNVESKTSPDEELPVLKKENVFIFEGYQPQVELPMSSGEGRSSSMPSCLQISDNFQTAIQDGLVLSESQPETRDVDMFLNFQGQSYSPENKTHLENRNFMASSIKKNNRNKAMMERFKNLDYLTADGLPDKELLAPISYGKQKQTKKKVKKSKKTAKKFESYKDSENSPRKNNNRKSLENIPVVWSFAGSNKASVKNHKLLHAAKSVRVALSTVGGNEKSDSVTHIKSDSLERMANTTEKVAKQKHISYYDQRDIENLVVPHPVFDISPSASVNNSTTPLISSSTSSILPPVVHPTLAMYGSKSPANPTPEKFHMTWKPRRIHRVSNSVLEVPPTPFMNIRISRNSEDEDE